MISSAILSALHVLALAIGLPGIFMRGVGLKRLPDEQSALQTVFLADAAWGIAAMLWLATGLTRALGRFEKGPEFYGRNHLFWVKMATFIAVVLLELLPMITFIQWRRLKATGKTIDFSKVPLLRKINAVELALTLVLPFLAAMMARGIGF